VKTIFSEKASREGGLKRFLEMVGVILDVSAIKS
jgi:hypothetical protein